MLPIPYSPPVPVYPISPLYFSTFSRRLNLSLLPEESNEVEEPIFSTIPKDLSEKDFFSREALEPTLSSSTPIPFERLSSDDRTCLSRVHSFIESAYPRIFALDLVPFNHFPFNIGYWPNRYLRESQTMASNWMATIPNLNRNDFCRFTIFQLILKRSLCPVPSYSPKYRSWAMRTVSKLCINHEVWLEIFSGCNFLPQNHTMILKVYRVSCYIFKFTLINVGYGYIVDRNDNRYCRDLITLANRFYEREFYDFLRKMFSQQPDVSYYYSIMQNSYPYDLRLGSKRPHIQVPFCATETYKRCYKDFLGGRLYASWMSYWVGKELSIIKYQLNVRVHHLLSKIDYTYPRLVKVSHVPAGTDTILDQRHTLTSRMYSLSDLNKFLKAATLTHRRYVAFSIPTIAFETSLPPCNRVVDTTGSAPTRPFFKKNESLI